jgi:ABC transporter substrate binding protein (PQQ-dependent alcohol dehydrogenase system)
MRELFIKPNRVLALALALLTGSASAAPPKLTVTITYVSRDQELPEPLSLLDMPVENNGWPGAELGLLDNQTTGSFLNQEYVLERLQVAEGEDLLAAVKQKLDAGQRLFIADLDAEDLLAVADSAGDALLFNIRAADNSLRNEQCRASVLHLPPSRAMVADALIQYLAWKRWNRAVLVIGRHANDRAYAESLKRAAKRFGVKIIEEKLWTAIPGARRTDSGHHTAQQEIPVFTRFKEHDVVLVADEADEFGEYLSYRATSPRPVAGTQGLLPTSWHRTQEQWGATQIQRRFEKLAARTMTERDYAAWAAMRSLGEAVTNTGSAAPADIRAFILSDKFKLAGFKGVPLTFRRWNGQLRQPVLLASPRMLVSVSPQKGYLHERSELDTLGFDKPESACQEFSE